MEFKNIKSEIHFRENFPSLKFLLKELTPQTINKLENSLREYFTIHKKESVHQDTRHIESLFIFSKDKLAAALYIDWNSSLIKGKFVKLMLFYSPTQKGLQALKLIEQQLKDETLPFNNITLKIFNKWGRSIEYPILPQEFTDNLIPELFYGIDAENLARNYLSSSQSILILLGEPGTGKSKLIQYIVGKSPLVINKPIDVLMIKGTENIKESADSINVYLENDLVILDDFDLVSFKRSGNDEVSNVVSTILSATDGFIPAKTKIIISTNIPLKEIDPAILRPSRLFDILELKPIPREHFEKICEKYPELSVGLELFRNAKELKVAEILDFIMRKRTDKNYLQNVTISKRNTNFAKEIGF